MPFAHQGNPAIPTSDRQLLSNGKCSNFKDEKPPDQKNSNSVPSPVGADFDKDDITFSKARITAAFYPKFDNDNKSNKEIRERMIELISNGQAILEVTLKHSGSLFMYAGHISGAYAKNSFGNLYTAVGVFVLSRVFREGWGTEAREKQEEFNRFLEEKRICISMELVTAVLGDHGQRPINDYVVVTAISKLGNGKPKFKSTPGLIKFCRKWRLPTNHAWLFHTKESVTSFFDVYDSLWEDGTATLVCKKLDDVANISVPGSMDHIKEQGEILEGLVARIVSCDSAIKMEEILRDFPLPLAGLDLGANLRELCAANQSDENQLIKALLEAAGTSMCPCCCDWFGSGNSGSHSRIADRLVLDKFLQARPVDSTTKKLQEMICLMMQKRYRIDFKCYYNAHKIDSLSSEYVHLKMVIHVRKDSVFLRYLQEMRKNHKLWPLYRGFFIDINLLKDEEMAAKLPKDGNFSVEKMNGGCDSSLEKDGPPGEDANLMIKLNFLKYKVRTFLIRNGLSTLFKCGSSAYSCYYLGQLEKWGTSADKQTELCKMLDKWALFILEKYANKQLSSSVYLSEAEPFLELYDNHSIQNRTLVASADNLLGDEEDDVCPDREAAPLSQTPAHSNKFPKDEGLLIFFPGMPGCAKSALCKEILNTPGGLGESRPVHTLMGDLTKGTDSNPFSLEALSVFIFRILQRVNHPGNLDKASPNVGYVLVMFYHLYDGKKRNEFERELLQRFGVLVKMPLLRGDR